MTASFKYRAFISYSHADTAWAVWLHKALEGYRIPKRLVGTQGRDGAIPAKLFPIYRDRDEFAAASNLDEHIKVALGQSAYLIVVCSPASAHSRWVNEELLAFKRLGREDRILAIIVDGEPNLAEEPNAESALECFPRALKFKLKADGQLSEERIEPAAADARSQGDGRENAKLKLIAGMLGVDYDGLKQRDMEATRRRTRFYRAVAMSMTVLAAFALAGGGLAYYYALRSQDMARAALIQAKTAEHTADFMVSLFSITNPEQNRGETITAREMLDRGVTQIGTELSGEQAIRGNLLRAMGQAYSGLGLYPKANSALKAALNAAQRGGSKDDILKARLALAANSYIDGDYSLAEQLFRTSLAQAQQFYGTSDPKVTEALVGLGDSQSALNKPKDAEANYRQALAIDLKLHGETNLDTARDQNALGTQLYFDARYSEAEALFRRALDTRISLLGLRHALVATSMSNLGSLEYDMGRYSAAEATWKRSLPIFEAVFGKEHPEVSNILNNIGRVQLIQGELDEAKTFLMQSLAMDRKFRSVEDDARILPLNSLAMIATAQQDYGTSEALLEEALKIAIAKNSFMLNQVLGNSADLYVRTDRLEHAEISLQKARKALKAQYGPLLGTTESWRAALLDMIDGSLQIKRRDFAVADRLLNDAYPILQKRFQNGGIYIARIETLLSQLYQSQGQAGKARHFRQLAVAHTETRVPGK